MTFYKLLLKSLLANTIDGVALRMLKSWILDKLA